MKYKRDFEDIELLENIDYKEVAKLTGYDPSYIWHLKNGTRTASWETYLKIKKCLTNRK